ncbi:hypothetical protein JDV02_009810 [Purpureocillium takamizusanense]|uniref:Mitochondrial pyruvate carrier n=1 Tax=Purpureocillium takamizusanense TaxID=2060973 RepID=A0A9Q8QQR0_9HYPO|nr:uncharacterized protein JDV02_009810 [Purpureocillium takamizusanense]UNI24030.1 hypothetical protein JDV02_009810 [Purpureocillium takamizusanense]
MVPSSTVMRASRPFLRQAATPGSSALAQALRGAQRQRPQFQSQAFRFRSSNYSNGGGKRWQSTSGAGAEQQQQQSWFKRAWESEVGIKTVHFWAPVMKWALVLAGISDFARPVEKLSFTQNFALTCTGLIWTRWCLIIKPKNYLLAAVNFFLGLVGIVQLTRIGMHESAKKNNPVAEVVEDVKQDVKDAVKA